MNHLFCINSILILIITFLVFNLFYSCYSSGDHELVYINQQNISYCGRRPPWTIFVRPNDLDIIFRTGRNTRSQLAFGYQIIDKHLITTKLHLIEEVHSQFETSVKNSILQLNERAAFLARTLLFVVPKLKLVKLKLITGFPQILDVFVLDGPGAFSQRIYFNDHRTVTCSSYQCTTVLFQKKPKRHVTTTLKSRALSFQMKKDFVGSGDALHINISHNSCFGNTTKFACPVWFEAPKDAFLNVTVTNISYTGLC